MCLAAALAALAVRRNRRARAGQDLRAQAVALGAAVASAAEGAGGLGRRRSRRPRAAPSSTRSIPSQQLGKAFDHYDMARDGIADLTYVNPGYQPGRFPIIAAGELPFLIGERQGRHRGARRLVPQIRGAGDEGRASSASPSCTIPAPSTREQEDRGARRHQGHEDPAGARAPSASW